MKHNEIDRVQVVREMFSTNGPHTPETMIAAAQAIAELWRYLGDVTISGTREVLTDPGDARAMTGALSAAEWSSVDVLNRLSLWARNIGDESTYTDYFGHNYPDDTIDQIQSSCHYAAGFFHDTATNHEIAARHLGMAQGALVHLYRASDDVEYQSDITG